MKPSENEEGERESEALQRRKREGGKVKPFRKGRGREGK